MLSRRWSRAGSRAAVLSVAEPGAGTHLRPGLWPEPKVYRDRCNGVMVAGRGPACRMPASRRQHRGCSHTVHSSSACAKRTPQLSSCTPPGAAPRQPPDICTHSSVQILQPGPIGAAGCDARCMVHSAWCVAHGAWCSACLLLGSSQRARRRLDASPGHFCLWTTLQEAHGIALIRCLWRQGSGQPTACTRRQTPDRRRPSIGNVQGELRAERERGRHHTLHYRYHFPMHGY